MKQTIRMPVFRDNLRELMGDLSVTDFAQKIGLSRQTVGFYLNGDRIPDCETLVQICNKCEVSANWLLGLPGPKSLDPKVAEIMQYTGLTEDNVNLLHADFDYLHDHLPHTYSSIFHLGKECFYTLANDLVHLLQNEMVLVRFRELQRIYTKFKDIGAANSFDETITFSDVERVTDRRGLATVPVHDGISFYAAQLAAEIQREIETKYAVPQRTESAFDLLK